MQMQGVAKRDYSKKSDLVINSLQPIERLRMNRTAYNENFNNKNYAIVYKAKKNP